MCAHRSIPVAKVRIWILVLGSKLARAIVARLRPGLRAVGKLSTPSENKRQTQAWIDLARRD